MRFEIVVPPHPADAYPAMAGASPFAADPGLYVVAGRRARAPRDVLEILVDGANVTARVRETHGVFVLRDLALALLELGRKPRGKAAVRFYDEPWEMCVERFGGAACVSVYRTGADPQVTAYDRAVPFDDVVAAVRGAVQRLLAAQDPLALSRAELAAAAEQLQSIAPAGAPAESCIPDPVSVVVEADRDAPISFGAEFTMRNRQQTGPGAHGTGGDGADESVERADLHALLFRGRVRAEVRGRVVDLGECHPVLVAERLVDIARRAFDAWERGLALHARGDAAGVLVGVRISSSGELALTLGSVERGGGRAREVHTFPALGAADLLEASLAFGRALVRAVLRRDRTQSHNLRLGPLRRALRDATEALREASQTESKVNLTPEPYRAFAEALDGGRPRTDPAPPAARLRYTPRWRAIVPGIDLRGTYLCGDRLVVGSATEMWALDRASGNVLWRADAIRGLSMVTPAGVGRLAPDGAMCVYDFSTGEVCLRTSLAPRTGGPLAGAVVHLPGLPRLAIVTEGQHHLVAVDLATGEPRWRWSWSTASRSRQRLSGAPRMKRSGRLLYFTCGDQALTALDVTTGSIVWLLRDRLRFRAPPTVTHDALFVVSGGAHGAGRLHCIDPYSGDSRWCSEIAPGRAPCTVEGTPIVASWAVAVPVRQKSGLKLVAFDRETGRALDHGGQVLAPSGTSWLAVDDAFVGNTPTGDLVAIDSRSGELRWRQVLGPCPIEADVPRRLEPVLRCGALFVPHAEVVVVGPRDGAVLGVVSKAGAIPDLLRVDERCDVYVAEESGHLAAFGALPRLSLVK